MVGGFHAETANENLEVSKSAIISSVPSSAEACGFSWPSVEMIFTVSFSPLSEGVG